jgi:protein-disulfide isomerase/thiol-disulfide isomerase/thioredoxin
MSAGGALALVGTGRARRSLARRSHFNRLARILRRWLVQDECLDDRDTVREPASSRSRSRRWVLSGLAATLLVGLLAYGVTAHSPNATIDDSLARGVPAKVPPFRLDTLQSGALGSALSPKLTGDIQRRSIALSELRGTPVVLNFWSSWCGPCKEEAPMLERTWQQRARPRGVLFLGLDALDTTSDARAFMRRYGIDYPNISDSSKDVRFAFGVHTFPQTFFIDRRGQIVGHVFGVISSQQLVDGITTALAGTVRGPREGEPADAERTDALVSSLLAGIQQHGNTLGDPRAPVTVQYFGDLQCPVCRRFTLSVLPSLIESYVRTGKLKIEYHSLESATQMPSVFGTQQVAALAAGRQDKMWNFIELFYQEQGPEHSGYVTERYLQGLAQQVSGLNLIEWTAARNDPELARTLTTDARVAERAGLNETPAFLLGHTQPRPPYLGAIKKRLEGMPSTKAGV